MEFKNRNELQNYLNYLKYLGEGSQGCCYLRQKDNMVLKIFHTFEEDDYSCETDEKDILKFSNIKNKTFVWPNNVVKVNGEVVGYMMPFINAKNLYTINPLMVNLNHFTKGIEDSRKDIKTVSNNGICTYDVCYNIMYNKKFYVIDQDEYSYSDKDSKVLYEDNRRNFDYEIYNFLIDSYFNGVVRDNAELFDLYCNKKEDVLEFIKLFRNRLNELSGKEIIHLKEAKNIVDKKLTKVKYQRTLSN